jgi:cyclopropane fatty-acyl-phospholipid synthase-like methyltransferase
MRLGQPRQICRPEFRMWRYYLLAAAATFQTGRSACWQFLLAPK